MNKSLPFQIIGIIVLSHLFALTTFANKFFIKGTIASTNKGMVYLSYNNYLGVYTYDSAKIFKSKFHFKGQISEPEQAIISFQTPEYPNKQVNAEVVYLESGKLNLTIKFENNKPIYTVKGSQTQNDYQWLTIRKSALKQNDTFPQNLSTLEKIFIEKNPHSVISASLIALNFQAWPIDTIQRLFNNLLPIVKKSKYGQKASQLTISVLENSPGQIAKNFSANDVNGNKITMMQFKGKYVLLDFWASWCAPCRASFPKLKDLYNNYHAKGLEIIGISEDENIEKWENAIDSEGISIWHNVLSGFSVKNMSTPADSIRISGKFGIGYFPTKILIDPNGTIIGRWVGESEDNLIAIQRKIQEMLK